MRREVELVALGLSFVGWLCATLSRCLPLWTVSGTLDNTTATLPAYWDGVWLGWDHWDLGHDGIMHCSFYQSLLSLSGNFRTWRALIMSSVGVGAFAVVISVVGAVWFPARAQVKAASGLAFVLSGILMLIPIAWTCHHTSKPLGGTVELQRDWGAALYIGWISFALSTIGGGILSTRCLTVQVRESVVSGSVVQSEEGVQSPLQTIIRTTFRYSQHNRTSVCV